MAGKRKAPPSRSAEAAAPTTRKTLILRRTKKARPATWRTRTLGFLKWSSITTLVVVLVAALVVVIAYKRTDIPDPNADFETASSLVYFDGGKDELGRYAVQDRIPLDFDQMPQDVKDAVVAAENKSFWTDSGISPTGIVRAAFSNASGNATQGGSTITQQYVKILYLNQQRSYKRKFTEALLSYKIQKKESKEEVLQGYLNAIYFGHGAYGIEVAAQTFFGVPAKKLSVRQAAVLASVLNNPSGLDPEGGRAARKALKERYRYVLDNMVDLQTGNDGHTQGITQAQADRFSRKLPAFHFQSESSNGGQKGFMLSMVEQQLLGLKNDDTGSKFTEAEIDGGGLRITTTLTKKAMDAAAAGVKEARPEGFGDKQLHVAVASVEPGTGALRGFYAGQDYLRSEINWAVAGGQAGSTFKAFTLAAALQAGYSIKDVFDGSSPLTLDDGHEVMNEGGESLGPITLTTAIEKSVNTAFVRLVQAIPDGPEKVIETANAMGIPPKKAPKGGGPGFPDHTPGLDAFPTVTLGPQTVSPINMANGYATIANEGVAADAYLIDKVTDADGNVLYQHQVTTHRAVSADIAADVSYTLQENVKYGTGQKAQALDRAVAGKTGTATNGLDQVSSAWFAGYTPQLATAVMYVRGKGNGQLDGWLPSYFGADYPTETWTDVMRRDMEGVDPEEFPPPAYVDGTAPETGHTYVPPATSTPTRRPTRRPSHPPGQGTHAPPTSNPPTSQPPTSQPPTQPPTSKPPTQPPTSAPPTTQPPTVPVPTGPGPGGPSGGGGGPGGPGGTAGVAAEPARRR